MRSVTVAAGANTGFTFNATLRCARCKKVVGGTNAEVCWWCEKFLCYDCWDFLGHCGHPEADEVNRQIRTADSRFVQRAVVEAALNRN